MLQKRALSIAFFYLFIIAAIGSLIRYLFIAPADAFQYQFLLHSHSHTAMLGWVYSALFILLVNAYSGSKGRYTLLFIFTQVSITGMMIAFALQGYATWSIIFSTIHVLLSYWFILKLYNEIRNNNSASVIFIRSSLFLLFLSSFGPWGLVFAASQGLSRSDLYQQCIYFYLHFQYNGWFIFAILGLIVYILEKHSSEIDKYKLKLSQRILYISVYPALLLTMLGYGLPSYLQIIAAAAGAAQLYGILIFIKAVKDKLTGLFKDKYQLLTVKIFLYSLLLKFIFQLVSAIPVFENVIFRSRDIILGYLHLVMLGVVTFGILSVLVKEGFIKLNAGFSVFIAGFVASEVTLFLNGMLIGTGSLYVPYSYYLLFVFSLMMLSGAGVLLVNSFRKNTDIDFQDHLSSSQRSL